DGRVKPDVVASGVGIATAEPAAAGVSPAYGTVNGSSAAAAAVAGAAAVLAEARPTLGAAQLRSILIGSAQRLPDEAVTSQGAGLVSLGSAAAAELAAEPATLAFGNAAIAPTKRWQSVDVTNVSGRPLRVRVRFAPFAQGAAAVELHATPAEFVIRRGQTQQVRLVATIRNSPIGTAPANASLV